LDITITRKDLSVAIRQNQIMWSIYARRIFQYILLLIFFGLVIFLPAAFSSAKEQSFWTWETIMGVSFLAAAVLWFFYHLYTRACFFSQLREQSNKWKQHNQKILIRITDEIIYYQDDEIKTEQKWALYSSYIIRKNLIILIRQRPFVGDFAIDMTEISKDEVEALLSFLQPMRQYNTGLFSE